MARTDPAPRHWRGLGILGGAALAAVTLAGGALAQSPAPVTPVAPSPSAATRPDGRMRTMMCAPGGPLDLRRLPRGWSDGRDLEGRRGADRWGFDGDRFGRSERRMGRPPRLLPRLGALLGARRSATVAGIAGNILTLTTADGWSRTIDTTSIALTRDGTAVTTADLRVGDRVRVIQQRADDGTPTVTAIEVLLAGALGTVGSLTDDGFELTGADGTTVVVRVSAATTWRTGCRDAGSLDALQVGALAVVRGTRADDGAIEATLVVTGGRQIRRPDRRMPTATKAPDAIETPDAAAPPMTSPST